MTEVRNLRDQDRAELLRFLRQQFPEHEHLATEPFFDWRYRHNPLVGRNDEARVFVATQRGDIVACMGAISDQLWDGHAWHDCQWLVNLVVAPEFRGGLDVLRLFQRAIAGCPITLTTGAGPHMRRLYQALGWPQLGICDTVYFPLRPAGLLRMARDTGRGTWWMLMASGLPAAWLATLAWQPLASIACRRWCVPKPVDTDSPSHVPSLSRSDVTGECRDCSVDTQCSMLDARAFGVPAEPAVVRSAHAQAAGSRHAQTGTCHPHSSVANGQGVESRCLHTQRGDKAQPEPGTEPPLALASNATQRSRTQDVTEQPGNYHATESCAGSVSERRTYGGSVRDVRTYAGSLSERPTYSGLRLRRIQRFDERIDALVERLLPALGVTTFRNRDYLSWKFVDRPCGTDYLWYLEDVATGQLRAYAAAKLMARPAVARWLELCDYLVHPDDDQAWHAVVGLICRTALDQRCDFIRMRLSIPQHVATLARPFWLHKRLAVSDDVFIYSPDRQLLDRLTTAPWHLTALVSDRCDYGRDEVERRKEEG